MNNPVIGRAFWVLPLAISLFLLNASAQTTTYSTAGVYTNVVPAGVNKVVFKLWGAGGGGINKPGGLPPAVGNGGGGAFSSVTLDAQPGDTFVIVVGQGGASSSASLGGAGSGNTEGGAPGNSFGTYTNRGQGGQASSVFFMTNNLLVTKAVAGAGGGAGFGLGKNGGAGGQAGVNNTQAGGGQPGANGVGGIGGAGNNGSGSPGGNYNNSAVTTGIPALNQAGGNGGSGLIYSGGGGGGYGGGGGGGGNLDFYGAGGGGGSYGTIVTNGNDHLPGNTSDVNYIGGAGQGGINASAGSNGLAVVVWIPADLPAPTLTGSTRLPDGSFRFAFTNINGAPFTALAATNVVNGSNNWTALGPATETAPGQFQFTDTQATNYPQRFYRVRSP